MRRRGRVASTRRLTSSATIAIANTTRKTSSTVAKCPATSGRSAIISAFGGHSAVQRARNVAPLIVGERKYHGTKPTTIVDTARANTHIAARVNLTPG